MYLASLAPGRQSPCCEEGWTEHLDFSFHSRRYRLSLQKTTNKTCPDIYLLTGQSEAIS